MIALGERIKQLRLRGGRTQEALAAELGVTAQAVSRWEKGICYPDMELVPSIANYFGVSIDELFGYDGDRSARIDSLYESICAMNRLNNGRDESMDECISLAREALIEFPGNEKLTLALASALFNAGYVRRGEFHLEDAEGYGVYDVERHRKYPEWKEAVKLYEKILPELHEGDLRLKAVSELSQLYKDLGEQEKALRLAESAPGIAASKPFLRIKAFDGREAVAASGEALIETVMNSSELIRSIVLDDHGIPPAESAKLLQNAVDMLGLVFTDGNYGRLNGFIACIHMLRSYYQWLTGDWNGAFASLDSALAHAKLLDSLPEKAEGYFTSPLLRHVRSDARRNGEPFAPELPSLWPWWDVKEYDKVRSGLEADPRWTEWVKRTAER